MLTRRNAILNLAAVITGLSSLACTKRDRSAGAQRRRIRQHSELALSTQTHDSELRAELARLESERATPQWLDASRRNVSTSQKTTSVPPVQPHSDSLTPVFVAGQLEAIDQQARDLIPDGPFGFGRDELKQAISFRKNFDRPRMHIRDLLRRSTLDFGLELSHGLLADMSFVTAARVYVRLEELMAAEYLEYGRPADAIEPLGHMLKMIARLTAEKHLFPRMAAAHLRLEAFSVLESILNHSSTVGSVLERAEQIVNLQLMWWAPDEDAWIGDRAVGLHTYELIRDGFLLSLLEFREIRQFRDDGTLNELTAAAESSIDSDQYYYLRTMRRIVDSCDRPFYKRKKTLAEIRARQKTLREEVDYPVIAVRLLLSEIERGHELQAQDRAACEAWAIAIGEALGREKKSYQTSPLTGRPYPIIRKASSISVWAGAAGVDLRPARVPRV